MADLIPGLPGDMAEQCLLRVPFDEFSTIGSVSKRWQHQIRSDTFHRLRKTAGLTRPVIAFVQSDARPSPPTKSSTRSSTSVAPITVSRPCYRVTLFEPGTGRWRALPPIPGRDQEGLPLFCQLASAGREVVVLGGWDPRTWASTDEVYVYDFVSAAWRRGAPMPGPRRSFFACSAVKVGQSWCVFVAGGHDESKNALRSALCYDVAADLWRAMPDMARARDEPKGVVMLVDGIQSEFHVIGGYPTEAQGRFTRSAEMFVIADWEWRAMETRRLEEGACPKNCVVGSDGKLYMCRRREVAVLEGSRWRAVAALPADLRAVLQVVAVDGELVVVGSRSNHGGATLMYVLEVEKEVPEWRRVDMPVEYSGHVQAACCVEI